ncbi:hypothetical protein GDO86_017109 [Hymenochirus boettgeri]|uniref:Chemerin-like receptor 2 n=1 Tax=Hymenochirus boettgeri TaxID=247094 RepID=A0A8T2IQJ3_9PIPI|nr:hypothetical protein GDO86_017109 [Hymenochirus boettgeri]
MENSDFPLYGSEDNYSNVYDYYEFDDTSHDAVYPNAPHIMSIVIYSLAFILGVPGNALVIWFTGFRWEKTVSTLWFLNLAIADFIFVLFLPLHITYVATNFHWPFGKYFCKMNSFIAGLNMFASVFFLTVIGLDRYLFLAHTRFIHKHRTLKKSLIVSGIFWISAAIIAAPALYYRDTKEIKEISRSVIICYNNFHEYEHSVIVRTHTSLTILRFLIGYLFPLITMVVCYTLLAISMKGKNTLASSKFFWTVFAIVVAFFACWTPYHIFSLLELMVHHNDEFLEVLKYGMPISTSLAFMNSCLNPIIYVLISKVFRVQLEDSVAKIFKNTLRDISYTGVKSDQLVDSKSIPTVCETVS